MPALSVRGVAKAAARTFVPFGGSALATHFDNLAALAAPLPAFDFPTENDRVLVVAPHPDDETLCCSGLLRRAAQLNIPARVMFVTNGDGSRTAQLFKTVREPLARDNDLFSLAQHRQVEALGALKELGLTQGDADFLGFPDGGLTTLLSGARNYYSPTTRRNHVAYPRAYAPGAHYDGATLLDVTARLFDEWKPTRVFTSHPLDTHADHAATFRLCQRVLQRAHSPAKLQSCLVHYGVWPVPNGLHLDANIAPPAALLGRSWQTLALSEIEIQAKLAALERYDSQLVSLPRYLRAFVRRNELYDSDTKS